MKPDNITENIEIPESVQVKIENPFIIVTGPKGEVKRQLFNPKISLSVRENTINLSAEKPSKKEKTLIGTYKAHIRNMIRGVQEGHVYKLKICSGHFPMSVSTTDKEFTIKNFLGEKVPRTVKIRDNVSLKLEGTDITIKSTNKELAGQQSADIEQLTKISKRDRRIFQDGIYIVSKDGKDLS